MLDYSMKHAYLIMAHHEFEVLGKLVQALDDERNDIYIHFDKKVKNYPLLKTKYTNLYILQKRTDIRWGHISQIKAEYALFFGLQPAAAKASINRCVFSAFTRKKFRLSNVFVNPALWIT